MAPVAQLTTIFFGAVFLIALGFFGLEEFKKWRIRRRTRKNSEVARILLELYKPLELYQKGKKMKRVTAREFFDAMEADFLPKASGNLVKRDGTGAIVAACAYGQAALHLGVDPTQLYDAVTRWGRNNGYSIFSEIINLNDGSDSTVPAIARYARSEYRGNLGAEIAYVDERTPNYGE